MENNELLSLSVEMLQRYAQRSMHPSTESVTHKHCIVGRVTQSNDQLTSPFFDQPCRIDAMVFWLCIDGNSVLTCNMKEYEVKQGSFAIFPPNSIVEMRPHNKRPYGGYVMVVDPNYLGEIDLDQRKILGMMTGADRERNILNLTEEEQRQVVNLYELAYSTIGAKSTAPFHEDIIRTLLRLFIYQVCDFVAVHHELESVAPSSSSRSEEYFRRFIKELSEHYLERQPVTFYADRLCISSRYLTTIVRRVSGLSVTDWMNRYVITEAKYLLKYSDMSIQEVAYKLNFPNQSFFGKYFKQHLGISPSAYRQKY